MRGSGAAQVRRDGDNLTVFVPPHRKEIAFWGVIVAAGPSGEADYTDHRYWVRRAWPAIDGGKSVNNVAEFEAHPDQFPTGPGRFELDGPGLPKIITATNIAEGVTAANPDKGGHMLPVGTPVWVEAVFDRGNVATASKRRTRKYIIRATSPHVLHPVKVTNDGGSSGDEDTQCDFTYTVKTIYGTTIAEEVTPLKARPATGALVAPSASSYGLGFWDENGDFQLWDANETLDTETCEEE